MNNKSQTSNSEHDNLWIEESSGVKFVTDGKYKCPHVKGSYTIMPFRNPSGILVARLQGYRPARSANAHTPSTSPKRFRKNFDSLRVADAKREQLIREDANCEQRTQMVETTLALDLIKDAEVAALKLNSLPPPDWTTGQWTFTQAIEYIAKTFKPCRNPKALAEAISSYTQHKDIECNLTTATLDSIKAGLKRLMIACPGKNVHEVTESDLSPLILRGTQVTSMRRVQSTYAGFFAWCMEAPRYWTPQSPVSAVKLPERKDDPHVPKILPVADVRKLLAESLNFKGGRLFLFCAVAFGCALRPAEIARILARLKQLGLISFHFGPDAKDNYIRIWGKCRQHRQVQIPPEFVPCIRAFVEAGYPVIPRNFFNDWTHLRALAGYLGTRGYLPNAIDPKPLQPWVDDYPRHTGGSHYFNRCGNEFQTAKWMGNSPKMLFAHYDGRPSGADTEEFYQIPAGLNLPTVTELRQRGVPPPATSAELRKLKCDVNRHTAYGMKKSEVEQARAHYLSQHPDAAKEERKGFTRGSGSWTKRKMLKLPPRDELVKLFWTVPLVELAKQFKVTRSTMSLIAADHKIPLPGLGVWQQRAAGKVINDLPEEVQKLFPEGLPPYQGSVGRGSCAMPPLAEFLKLLWEFPLTPLAAKFNCSLKTLDRAISGRQLPKPGHSFWHTKPEKRQIPHPVKHLLTLDSVQLARELAKNPPPSADVCQPE